MGSASRGGRSACEGIFKTCGKTSLSNNAAMAPTVDAQTCSEASKWRIISIAAWLSRGS